MALNRRCVAAPAAVLWDVLSDGHLYSRWVVGTSHIRAVDAGWPNRGTAIHYQVGRGPVRHEGHTKVLTVDPERRLELEIHAWPAGRIRVVLELRDLGGACEVTMVEKPVGGVAGLLHNPVGDGLLRLRNVETLRRLDRLACERLPAGQR